MPAVSAVGPVGNALTSIEPKCQVEGLDPFRPGSPNRASIVRLVGAVLCELNDDWTVVRRYMTLDDRKEDLGEPKALAPPKKNAA